MRISVRARFCFRIVALLILAFGLTESVLADDEECTDQSLRGSYVVSIGGFITPNTPPQFAIGTYSPVTVVGTYVFDGGGNVSRSLRVNFAGQPFAVTDTGLYQVNSNCSGTASFSTNHENLNFTPIDSDTFAIVSMTPGQSGAGTLTKQTATDCSTRTLRGTWIFAGNGLGTFQHPPQFIDSFFPVAVAGLWTFDGNGNVFRSLSLNFAGFPGPYTDAGSYQVNSDCSASAYFPSDAEPFDLFIADAKHIAYGVTAVGRAGTGLLRKQTLDQ